MSKPDKNLCSFNGPLFNGVTVDWTDRNIEPEADIADTIKCSTGLRNFKLSLRVVKSGYEDALDVNNRCEDLDISAELWDFTKGNQSCGFTLKGGSRNVRVSGMVIGDPLVDIGNASDQSHEPTTGVSLNLKRIDGKAIRVRVLGGDLPTLEDGSGPYRFVFPWRFKWLRVLATKAFLELRRHTSL